MIRTFFFQQNDTKINDFDEGVLILEPFFWGNVISKFAPLICIKSHVWVSMEYNEWTFSSLPRIWMLQSHRHLNECASLMLDIRDTKTIVRF